MRQSTDPAKYGAGTAATAAPTATTATAAARDPDRAPPRTTGGFVAVTALNVAVVAAAMAPAVAASVAVVVGVSVLAAWAGRRVATYAEEPPDEARSVPTPATPAAD